MKTALTIAGSDPSGGAGIQADLRAFADNEVRGLSAITAVTAQDGVRVASVNPVSSRIVAEQVEVLLSKFRVDAVKIGMLGTSANARAVAGVLKKHGLGAVVLDPVLASTGGVALIGRGGAGGAVEAIRKMLPQVLLITPNTVEAGIIAGMAVTGVRAMEEAARRIYEMGAPNVLVKGGHLRGAPVDVLYDGRGFTRFSGRRMRGPAECLHGTGCVLSAAIAAYLARGKGLGAAVGGARAYLEKVIADRLRSYGQPR